MLSKVIIIRILVSISSEKLFKDIVLDDILCFCVHAVFFPTLPFIGMTVLISGLPVVIRYAADYGQTRKEKFQTWAGLQWSSSGASALPKQPPSSVLQFLPFTVCPGSPLLTRSPPVTCGREIGIRFASKTVWFVLLSVLPFSLFSASPNVLFHSSI